jgi:hypothetical protein
MFDPHLPEKDRIPADRLEHGARQKRFHISFHYRAIRQSQSQSVPLKRHRLSDPKKSHADVPFLRLLLHCEYEYLIGETMKTPRVGLGGAARLLQASAANATTKFRAFLQRLPRLPDSQIQKGTASKRSTQKVLN